MRNCQLFQTVCDNMRTFLFLAALMALCQGTGSTSVTCLVCSYNYAGDGTTDYECVSEPRNHTQISTANCTSGFCFIRTVYTTGYGRVSSLYRGCGTADVTGCDSPDAFSPACSFTCTTTECNDQDGNLWTGNDGGGGGAASQPKMSTILCLSLPVILLKIGILFR